MEHIQEPLIKCPYCDWEDNDSWEFGGPGENEGVRTCGACERDFIVNREVEITYTTKRIKCKASDHDYKFRSNFQSQKRFIQGTWIELPKEDHTFHRIEQCTKCGDEKWTQLDKPENDA